jgi:hypothetical protein
MVESGLGERIKLLESTCKVLMNNKKMMKHFHLSTTAAFRKAR